MSAPRARPRVRTRAHTSSAPNEAATPDPPSGSSIEYSVGYGKPPKANQFAKGKSGNPKGRKRGSKNAETYYLEALTMPVKASVGGEAKQMPALKAVIFKQLQKALQGDNRSIEAVVQADQRRSDSQANRSDDLQIRERDQQILEAARERMRRDLAAEKGEKS